MATLLAKMHRGSGRLLVHSRSANLHRGCSSVTPSLYATDDRFGGKLISLDSVASFPSVFAVALASSLAAWRAERKRGVWLAVPVHRTELLPAAISAGFELHHTEPDRIVLNQWLEDSASMMPGYTTHTAGVGAVVINARRQVLAIQEASGPASKMGGADGFWKYPTGLVEAGEGVAEAAVREVREECGIDTEVVSLVAWREAHMGAGGGGGAAGIATNLFAVFLMRPTGSSEELRTDAREVAAAKWMDADAYLEQSKERMPEGSVYYTLNHLAIQAYDGLQVGMQGRMLPLGAKLAPGVSNMVYHTEPKL